MAAARGPPYHALLRPRTLTTIAAGCGLASTAVIAFNPHVRFAYRNVTLHVGAETMIALIGALVSYLAFGRFRQSRRLSDIAVAYAMMLLSFASLGFSAVPIALWGAEARNFATWASIATRMLGACVLVMAGLLSDQKIGHRHGAWAVLGALAPLAVIAIPVAFLAPHLPTAVHVSIDPDRSGSPTLSYPFGVLAVQLVFGLLYGAAAVGFTRRAEVRHDEPAKWLGAGCAIAAVARLDYSLFPSIYSEYFYAGDVLRVGAYLLWLVGAGREIESYWHGLARSAVLEERRRVARDLHDGLAQELAFIATQTARVSEPAMRHVRAAAERALDESRRAIAALANDGDGPLGVAVAQEAESVAERLGVRVSLDIDDALSLPSGGREVVLRIMREAITNAARHGGATQVWVRLWGDDKPCLSVRDDGSGFDPATVGATVASGFGLVSMRERAEAVGARFILDAAPGRGTSVTLAWD